MFNGGQPTGINAYEVGLALLRKNIPSFIVPNKDGTCSMGALEQGAAPLFRGPSNTYTLRDSYIFMIKVCQELHRSSDEEL